MDPKALLHMGGKIMEPKALLYMGARSWNQKPFCTREGKIIELEAFLHMGGQDKVICKQLITTCLEEKNND